MEDCIVVYITCPSKDEAEGLARQILEQRLAACASVVNGVRSFTHGENAIEQSEESLIILRTMKQLLDHLTALAQTQHSLDVPEIIALPITGGSDDYANWINSNTRGI